MYYSRNPLYTQFVSTRQNEDKTEAAKETRVEAQERRASCCGVCVRCINGLVSRIVGSVTCVFSNIFHHAIVVGVSENDKEELETTETAAT